MEAKLIEKLDRRRFTYQLWFTIGMTMLLPDLLYHDLIEDHAVEHVSGVMAFVGFVLFIVFTVKNLRNEKEIKSSPELKAALNNEMVRMHKRKSYVWAASTALVVSLIMDALASCFFPQMTVHMVCMTVYFATALAGMIVRLVYMRK